MEKLLLHICCAPCSIRCVETLRDEGFDPVGYWYNPNIHPYTEYKARLDTLKGYAASIGLPLVIGGEYGLRQWLDAVGGAYDARCPVCYRLRTDATARYAAENGFDAFCTTLLISPYQDHDALVAAARDSAKRYGVAFLERDFRPYFREGQAKARALGLYMQKYCGCILSEEDRYRKKPKKA